MAQGHGGHCKVLPTTHCVFSFVSFPPANTRGTVRVNYHIVFLLLEAAGAIPCLIGQF